MHQYAPINNKSQRGLNSNDYNIPAEAGIINMWIYLFTRCHMYFCDINMILIVFLYIEYLLYFRHINTI